MKTKASDFFNLLILLKALNNSLCLVSAMLVPCLASAQGLYWSGWSEVPGNAATDVALGSTVYNGALYLFSKGLNSRIFLNRFDGAAWTGWSEVFGSGTTDVALGAAVYSGRLYLFGRGIGDSGTYVNSLNGNTWSGWSAIPGGATTDAGMNAAPYFDGLMLFRKAINQHIFLNALYGGWGGWLEVSGSGTTDRAVFSAIYKDGAHPGDSLYLFAKGVGDQRVYVNKYYAIIDSQTWSGWNLVPGGATTDSALTATAYGGYLYLFRKGDDQHIYANAFDATNWTGWSEVGGNGTTDVGLNATSFGGKLCLFRKGVDQKVYLNLGSSQPNGPPTGPTTGPDTPNGAIDTYGAATTAGLMFNLAGDGSATYAVSLNAGVWKSINGGAWSQLAQSPRYAACIAMDPNNSAHLAVGERDGDATDLHQNGCGVWESFDAGATWSRTLDPLSLPGCASAAISGIALSHASTLFVATGCGIGRKTSGAGAFDFSHTPAGITWVTAVTPSETKIWARTQAALLVSSNDGQSWTTINFPSSIGGLTIWFPSRGDLFALGAFDSGAFMTCAYDPTSPCGNMNRLLIYNAATSSWLLQPRLNGSGNPALGCDGTGCGGRRFVKSFLLNRPDLPGAIGQRLQLFVGVAQEVYQASGVNSDGTISSWTRVAFASGACTGGIFDPIHSDFWDFLLTPSGSLGVLAGDGGVFSKSWPSGGWVTYNQSLPTHHIHTLTVLPGDNVIPSRIAYATSDNDAWYYDPGAGWSSLGCLGDANWTAGDAGNANVALLVRATGLANLTGFTNNLPNGLPYECGIVLNNNGTFDGPLSLQFIQTLKGETAYPFLDAVMLTFLPLQYNSGGTLVNVPGPLGQPNPGGNPVLIRATQFTSNLDANTSRFQNWQLLANDLPLDTSGFWVSGGHANPVFYCYTSAGRMYKRNTSGSGWTQLPIQGLLIGSGNGPAFVNPYDPNKIYALTSCGAQVSSDGGANFRGEAVLTALVTGSGKYPLTSFFYGGNDFHEPLASRANAMGTLSDMGFLRDDPRAMVTSSPFTGVFFNAGDGLWRDLTPYLPTPFTPVAAVRLDRDAVYVATEGRGLARVAAYQNAPPVGLSNQSPLKILSVTHASGQAAITWQACAGCTYRVQYKDNLSDPLWTDLPGDVVASCLTASKTDSTLGSAPQRFYRVVLFP